MSRLFSKLVIIAFIGGIVAAVTLGRPDEWNVANWLGLLGFFSSLVSLRMELVRFDLENDRDRREVALKRIEMRRGMREEALKEFQVRAAVGPISEDVIWRWVQRGLDTTDFYELVEVAYLPSRSKEAAARFASVAAIEAAKMQNMIEDRKLKKEEK